MTTMSNYHISDEDIEASMRYLKYHDPKHATTADAEKLLHDLKAGHARISDHDPAELAELQKEIDGAAPEADA